MHTNCPHRKSQIQLSSVPWPSGSLGEHERWFSRDPLPIFSVEGSCVNSSCMGRDVHSLMLSIQHFLCQPQHCPHCKMPWRMVLERLSSIMMWDIPEPCELPSLDSCQKRFLWTRKEADLVPHPVVGLALQVGDSEKFPHALGFKTWIMISESASRVHVSQP